MHQNSSDSRYCSQCGARLNPLRRIDETRSSSAELRQGTFLFCDLVQSTSLANRLDVEELLLVFEYFRRVVSEITQRNSGRRMRFEGDGALLSFGLSGGSEDPAESAVRAGLELVEEVHASSPVSGVTLGIRVGIASGTVAADLIDEDSVVGSVVHLAARLQGEAAAGQVLIADSTRKQAGRFFEYQDLGLLTLKGFDEAPRAWLVLRESSIGSRFDARHEITYASVLVGREEPKGRLADCWRGVCSGEGQAALVVGEAGIGKSRLVRMLRDSIIGEGALAIEFDHSQRSLNTPLYPVVSWLKKAAGVAPGKEAGTRPHKLREWLLAMVGAALVDESLKFLAPLVDPNAPAPSSIDSPDLIRERTIDILIRIVCRVAAERPVLIVCEDVHWADATTRLLLVRLGQQSARLPVLIVATARKEFDLSWFDLPLGARIDLAGLDEPCSRAVVRQTAGKSVFADSIEDTIVHRGEGNPLFLEEMTRSVVECGPGASALRAALSADVPIALQPLIQARLDRWVAEKPVAQAAAVIGRDFSLPVLKELLNERHDLPEMLGKLVAHDVLAQDPDKALGLFRFKHALIHDAVYRTMMRAERQRLHSRTAEILVRRFDGQPDMLAHHLAIAGRYEEAVRCFAEASQKTSMRAAYLESIGHSRAGLELIERIEDVRLRTQLKRRLLTQLGVALAATSGYAHPEVERTYEEARALCEVDDDPAELFPIVRGLGTFYFVRCNLVAADEVSLLCIQLARQSQRKDLLIEAMSFRGYTCVYMGRIAEGRAALENCVDLYREHQGERFHYPSAQDAGTAGWSLLGIAAWLQGDTARSEHSVQEALNHAQRLGRPFDQAYAHVWIAMLRNLQRRFDAAAMHASASEEIAARHGFTTWLHAARMHGCIAAASRAASPEAVEGLRLTLAAFVQAGAEANAPFFLWGIARGQKLAARADDARQTLAEANARARATQEAYLVSELLLLQAELEPDPQGARALQQQALELAESQGGVVLALRAALKLLDSGSTEAMWPESLRLARQCMEGEAPYPESVDWAQRALLEARRLIAAAPEAVVL